MILELLVPLILVHQIEIVKLKLAVALSQLELKALDLCLQFCALLAKLVILVSQLFDFVFHQENLALELHNLGLFVSKRCVDHAQFALQVAHLAKKFLILLICALSLHLGPVQLVFQILAATLETVDFLLQVLILDPQVTDLCFIVAKLAAGL